MIVLATGGDRGAARSDGSPTTSAEGRATTISEFQTRVTILETRIAGGTTSTSESPTPDTGGAESALGPGPVSLTIENGMLRLYVYSREGGLSTTFGGELLNTTDVIVTTLSSQATFVDTVGAVIKTLTFFSPLESIPTNGRMGFEGSTQKKAGEWPKSPWNSPAVNPRPTQRSRPNRTRSNSATSTRSRRAIRNSAFWMRSSTTRSERSVPLYGCSFTPPMGAGSEYRLSSFSYLAPGKAGSRWRTAPHIGAHRRPAERARGWCRATASPHPMVLHRDPIRGSQRFGGDNQ